MFLVYCNSYDYAPSAKLVETFRWLPLRGLVKLQLLAAALIYTQTLWEWMQQARTYLEHISYCLTKVHLLQLS